MKINSSNIIDAAGIFSLGVFLFLIGLSGQEIVGFESRFYLFALEMWRHGGSWFPTTYLQPYPDYPVTTTWLIYLAAKLAGGLNKSIAVLPSALAAAMTLSATYLLGALHSRKWGWFAVGFLLFTNAFLAAARSISLDVYVAAFTVISFYVAYAAHLQQKKMPWLTLIILLALSFSVRGPIGLIIPTAVLCVFYLLEQEIKKLFCLGVAAFFTLLVCGGILLVIAHHVGGSAFMHDVLNMEVLGRMQRIKTPPWSFYFTESLGAYAVSYPLALLILIGLLPQIIRVKISPTLKFLQVLAGWVLIILVGLSCAADKKPRYILAIAPALSLICAYLFVMTTANFYLRYLKIIFKFVCRFFPIIALSVVGILALRHVELAYQLLIPSLVFLQILALFFWRSDKVFFIAVLSFVVCYFFIVEKINLHANQTRNFVAEIEAARLQQHARLVFFREGTDGTVIKYLVNMPREEFPVFVEQFTQIPDNAFVISASENFPALKQHGMQEIFRGKIGHDEYVVSKTVSHR